MAIKKRKTKIYGIATNDADYPVDPCIKVNGKTVHLGTCPYYRRWRTVLGRCFSKSSIENNPSYAGNKLCVEWLLFSNFKLWMEQQDWEGKVLDKDLLVYGNNVYSPETCVFVPAWLNNLFLDARSRRGNLPLGVHYQQKSKDMKSELNKPYLASIRKDNVLTHLGNFKTPEEAHLAWQTEKLKYIEHKCKIFEGTELFDKAILPRIMALKDDILNKRITENLHHNRI